MTLTRFFKTLDILHHYIRSVQGNLRLCRNLAYGSLLETCRQGKKIVTIHHVNAILVQPHWRSHDELIQQQVAS